MRNLAAKFRLILLGAMLGGLVLGAGQAHAVASDPCALSSGNYIVDDGDSCTVDLTQSNVDFFDNQIMVRLLINNPSTGNTTITLSLESAPGGLTLLGFDRFGLNSSSLTPPAGWDLCGGNSPFNISSFGNFTACANDSGGNDSSPSFDVGTSGSFAANSDWSHFVSHMRFSTNPSSTCSAFAGDADVDTNPLGTGECAGGTTPPNPVPPLPTPEPSTFFLLGAGMLSMASWSRRKKRSL